MRINISVSAANPLTAVKRQVAAYVSNANKLQKLLDTTIAYSEAGKNIDSKLARIQTLLGGAPTKPTTTKPAVVKPVSTKPETVKPSADAKPDLTKPPINLSKLKNVAFDKRAMSGEAWFKALNGQAKPRLYVEGYWREKYNVGLKTLPFPVIYNVKGYDKTAFVKKLQSVQARAKKTVNKGYSPNRWTGGNNGAAEYKSGKWSWPAGLTTYLSAGVPPSAEFYKFIMGKSLAGLPTYNR